MKKVIVLGSLNMDLSVSCDRFPKIGETILGQELVYYPGGKGANQAVAAAKMQVPTILLGKIGRDPFGEKIWTTLKDKQIDLSHIEIEEGMSTGTAVITRARGDNHIIVISGANEKTDEAYVDRKQEVISEAGILLGQLEIPISALCRAFKIAKQKNIPTLLNPAPFCQALKVLLPYTDYLTPNETEFNEIFKLFGQPKTFEEDLLYLEKKLGTKVIVTRGSKGAAYIDNNQVCEVPAIPVEVADTTGAGDTFNGILAVCLSQNMLLKHAVKWATLGASISVEKVGAQEGMPTLKEIKKRGQSVYF